MIVVDASVLVTALGDDGPDGSVARRRLRGEQVMAPHLIDVEVVSAWRRLSASGGLGERRVALAIEDLRSFPLQRVPHEPLLARSWELRSNLTIYDAMYVALAELAGSALLTADRRLADAPGLACQVELLR